MSIPKKYINYFNPVKRQIIVNIVQKTVISSRSLSEWGVYARPDEGSRIRKIAKKNKKVKKMLDNSDIP
jgi:hypothetical protein